MSIFEYSSAQRVIGYCGVTELLQLLPDLGIILTKREQLVLHTIITLKLNGDETARHLKLSAQRVSQLRRSIDRKLQAVVKLQLLFERLSDPSMHDSKTA